MFWGIGFSVMYYLMQEFGMQSRYSRALAVAPEDVELLTNVGDCCVQRAELFHSALQHSGGPVVSPEAWAPVKEIYEHGLQVHSNACANADTRIGDDLGGLLQNWSAGLLSFAEVGFCISHDL
jgi:hypothetical protein